LPWTKMRQAYALLSLCEKYGDGRVEAICQSALEHRSRRFHSDLDHFRKAIDKHSRAMISCMPEVRACNGGRRG